jgi:TPP-dependent pyruvate/acetoin dehydrogenase alpha subunit
MRRDDYVFGGHRAPAHAHAIICGVDINILTAELAGRSRELDEFEPGDLNATQGNQPENFATT